MLEKYRVKINKELNDMKIKIDERNINSQEAGVIKGGIKLNVAQKQMVIAGVLYIILIAMHIIDYMAGEKDIIEAIMYSLSSWCVVISYLTFSKLPVLTMILLIVSNWFTIISDMCHSYDFGKALLNTGIIEIISWVALPLFVGYILKEVRKDKSNKDDKLLTKVRKIITYKKDTITMPGWLQFVAWCFIITVVLKLINSEYFSLYNNYDGFKLYAALTLTIPIAVIVCKMARLAIGYQFMVLLACLKLYTVYVLYVRELLEWQNLVCYIIEISAILLSVLVYRMDTADEREQRHLEKMEERKKRKEERRLKKEGPVEFLNTLELEDDDLETK